MVVSEMNDDTKFGPNKRQPISPRTGTIREKRFPRLLYYRSLKPGLGLRGAQGFGIFDRDMNRAAQCCSCCRLSNIFDGCPR